MDNSPAYRAMYICHGDAKIRVTVGDGILLRAPWFCQGLEAVIAVAGEWWPEDACIGDELDWLSFTPNERAFFVPDWVMQARDPRASRVCTGIILRLCPWIRLVTMPHVWYLADSIYRQLSERDSAFAEAFSRENFRNEVQSKWAEIVLSGVGKWRIAFAGVISFPLAVGHYLKDGCLYAVLSIAVKFWPRSRWVRLKQVRLRRRYKGAYREFVEAL